MPGRSVRSTIVYRLWLALCNVALAFTTLTLAVYIWLSVADYIENSHYETMGNVELLARVGLDEVTIRSTVEGIDLAREVGIERIDVYNGLGRLVTAHAFLPNRPPPPEWLDADVIAEVRAGERSATTISIENGAYRPQDISPWHVIRGGAFGEEHILPFTNGSNEAGSVRIVASYPDITHEAHTLIARSVIMGFVIIGAILTGVWLLLRHFITKPLERYSELAMSIAIGERVRMPANGRDELSILARAVNGMADALEHQATVDALTGLHNLRHLSSQLEILLTEAKAASQPLAIVFCDLDNLKQINDSHGHEAGDAVLRAVAASIKIWSAATYHSWRLGGDEFVIALPNVDSTEATIRAEKLRKMVYTTLIPVADTQIRTSISLGIASYPEDGDSPALLGIADRRMYESKTADRLGRLTSTPAA